jgi:hypothetical protein
MAVLSTAADEHWVDIVDISRTGARLAGEISFAVGQPLTFKAAEVRADGEVVWCKAGICAIEFSTPISASEVQQLGAGRDPIHSSR